MAKYALQREVAGEGREAYPRPMGYGHINSQSQSQQRDLDIHWLVSTSLNSLVLSFSRFLQLARRVKERAQ
jgi:hypothetical protein